MSSLNKSQTLKIEEHLAALQDFLRDDFVPFWLSELPDPNSGGYRALPNPEGTPEQESRRNLTEHADSLRACAALYRSGIGGDALLELARDGMEYLLDRFCDALHGGWFRSLELDGTPSDCSKSLFDQSRVLQALSEYGMASGDPRAPEWAAGTFQTCQTFAADNCFGGYCEEFARDWSHSSEEHGPLRKSFRSHTNFLYALTLQYEATGRSAYAQKVGELIRLIVARFLHPEHGTGIPWCAPDWSPAVQTGDEGVRSEDTCVEWNMDFAATVVHARNLLGEKLLPEMPDLRPVYDGTLRSGIDLENGHVFRFGSGGERSEEREHASQDEHWVTLSALLDAFIIYQEPRYLEACESLISSIGPDTLDAARVEPASVRWLLRLEEQLIKITL